MKKLSQSDVAATLFADMYHFSLPKKWAAFRDTHADKIIQSNGNLPHWLKIYAQMDAVQTSLVDLSKDALMIGKKYEIDPATSAMLETQLLKFSPWRKGPYELFGVLIDAEWRSDWKWNRIAKHLDLADKRILDIGCGNGYHLWRMLDAGAKLALGIDPSLLFLIQFLLIKSMITEPCPVMILPFKLKHLPSDLELFDITFSMGVLYHRKSPLHHLSELKNTLVTGGVLILETLVIDGVAGQTLTPKNRYAKMRNVWFIPSIETLKLWLERTGFTDISVLDITSTTVDEQRATKWMDFESLIDFLDPNDHKLTIEGYPAPKRVAIMAMNSK